MSRARWLAALTGTAAVVAVIGCGGGTLDRRGAGGGGVLTGMAGGGGSATGGSNVVGDGGANGSGRGGASSGNTAGRGGIGAIGGTGGSAATTGRGGNGESCVGTIYVPPPICGSKCGNGVRDTCPAPTIGFCPPTYWTEECDGADVGGESCATLGFGSGPLTCAADCTVARTTCTECLAPGGDLVRCGHAPVATTSPVTVAIAATDTEVGIAWVDYDDNGFSIRLSFARLSPALELNMMTRLEDATLTPPSLDGLSITGAAVAPLPSGWIVAAGGEQELFLHAIAPDGQRAGRTIVARALTEDILGLLSESPILASRPDGGPLLLWQSPTALRAAVIAADGRSTTTPVALPLDGLDASSTASAAWVDGAFVVAVGIQPTPDKRALRLFRIATDGRVTGMVDALPDESPWIPKVVTGAADLRVVYGGSAAGVPGGDPTVVWRRLTGAGQPITPPVLVGTLPDYGGPSPAVAFGDDTVILVGGYNGLVLGIARVALDGRIVTPVHPIARGSYFRSWTTAIARRGVDAVVAWVGGAGIELARLTP